MARITGTVTYFDLNKGFGFVKTSDGKSIYVHKSAIDVGRTFPGYRRGDTVEFEVGENEKGLCASAVVLKNSNEDDNVKQDDNQKEKD